LLVGGEAGARCVEGPEGPEHGGGVHIHDWTSIGT
jgi:hypothetical protein